MTVLPSHEKILVFIPMYNCEKQIARVLAQFNEATQALVSEIIIVDNRSTDKGAVVAEAALKNLQHVKIRLLKNNANYGLGGSHKVAFNYAIQNQFDYCIVLHGDDQGHIQDLVPYLQAGIHRQYDCVLGARFMRDSVLTGYSTFRTLGNKVYNLLYSLISGTRLYDLGAGLNIYKISFLKELGYMRFANNLTFNYFAILATVARKAKFKFFPLTWREDDQISNVKLFRQSLQGLKILFSFAKNKKNFIEYDFSQAIEGEYSATIMSENR